MFSKDIFYPAHTEEEGKSVLRALHQDPLLIDCHHLIYAYKFMDINGEISSGYNDDGNGRQANY